MTKFVELILLFFILGFTMQAGSDFYGHIKSWLKKDKSEVKCFFVATKKYEELEEQLDKKNDI